MMQRASMPALPARKYLLRYLALAIVCSMFAVASASELYKAAEAGDLAKVRALIRKGDDVNAKVKEEDNATPLHIAAYGGHTEVVEALIAAGADLETRDTMGFAPLHSAAMNGKKDVALVLLVNGAVVDSTSRKNRGTPLGTAVMSGDVDIVACLLAAGASVTWGPEYNTPPLLRGYEQVQDGHYPKKSRRIFAMLIAAGATVPKELQKYAASPEVVAEVKEAKAMLAAARKDLEAARKKYGQGAKRPAATGEPRSRWALAGATAAILLGVLVLAVILRICMRRRKGPAPSGGPG